MLDHFMKDFDEKNPFFTYIYVNSFTKGMIMWDRMKTFKASKAWVEVKAWILFGKRPRVKYQLSLKIFWVFKKSKSSFIK